jgi:hypothetical protein
MIWLKALQTKDGRPFLSNLPRFGLIPDPDSPQGLPIGITAQTPLDFQGFGEVIGISCAACHVGQFDLRRPDVRLDGAPNLFDINSFFLIFLDSFEDIFRDRDKQAAFFQRLKQHGEPTGQRSIQFFQRDP